MLTDKEKSWLHSIRTSLKPGENAQKGTTHKMIDLIFDCEKRYANVQHLLDQQNKRNYEIQKRLEEAKNKMLDKVREAFGEA